MRKNLALWCGQCVKSHPFMKNPMIAFLGVTCLIGRLLLYFMKIFCNLMDLVTHRKKESAIVFAWAVLVIVAIVSITKIIQIHVAEDKRESDIQALQREYVAESSENEDLADKPDASSFNTNEATEDDPNAWYHDIDVDFEGLKEINSDIVGWIYFEGDVGISYPLLYSGDDYYLNHNYLKEEESAGSIYIEKNNNPDLSDVHTLIYGHNMRNLSMFGRLRYYKTEEDYLKTHRYFQLITETGAYRYEIFAYKDVNTLSGGIYTTWKYVDDDFKEFVEDTICQGSYVDTDIDVDDGTHIVTLSTCSYDSDVRFTVSATRVDVHMWK
ncbi:MAG: class B sortase [Pseudobutyrivibrio sp.]|nr:class B sortase [Pseudobutyrivibrio sp.]